MDAALLRSLGFWLDVLGGVALLALAAAVVWVRPRRPVNLAFAGYAAAVGLAIVGANALIVGEQYTLFLYWFVAGIGVAGACLFTVGFRLDTEMGHTRRRTWPLAVACALPWVADRILVRVFFGPMGGYSTDDLVRAELLEFGIALGFSGLFFVTLLAAVRTRAKAWRMTPQVASLLTIGLVALPAIDQAMVSSDAIENLAWQDVFLQSLRTALFLVCGTAWLAAIPRVGRPALVAGLVCFFLVALGVLAGAASTGSAIDRFAEQGSYGLFGLIGASCLAYAILRHQMFDIDIKIKWTLHRGTVAFAFLAVFFVVAQVAQNFLSTRLGWGLGGAAAGLMLFAFAPIQRAAERLSDRALPDVKPRDDVYVLRKKRETYRNALAAAWSDGTLTAKDQRLLAEFKEALGLPHDEYAAIERDWARTPTPPKRAVRAKSQAT